MSMTAVIISMTLIGMILIMKPVMIPAQKQNRVFGHA